MIPNGGVKPPLQIQMPG